MKKIFYLFGLLTFGLFSCQEVNDLVQLAPPAGAYDQLTIDTAKYASVKAQPKNVLLEDYTGDMCDNCPTAQSISLSLENANTGRVSVIGIHCTDLAKPYPGYPDYRTYNGTQLMNYFFGGSGPSSLPTGSIDRTVQSLTSPPSIAIPDGLWSNYVNSELQLTPKAALQFSYKSYDAGTRILSTSITTSFPNSSTDTFYVSAAVIESGFKGVQINHTTIDSNFVFEHVLRKLMLPYNGLNIANSPSAGTTVSTKFITKLDPSWNADSCKIVAFVHHRSPINNYVEQVQETTVK